MYSHVDLCRVMHSHVDLCMVMYGHVDLYRVMHSHVDLCRLMYRHVDLCRVMYCHVDLCRVMYGHVDLCMVMYGHVDLYRVMYSHVDLCRGMQSFIKPLYDSYMKYLRRSRFLVLTKRSAASGDENDEALSPISFPEPTCLLVSTKTGSSGIINFQRPGFLDFRSHGACGAWFSWRLEIKSMWIRSTKAFNTHWKN